MDIAPLVMKVSLDLDALESDKSVTAMPDVSLIMNLQAPIEILL